MIVRGRGAFPSPSLMGDAHERILKNFSRVDVVIANEPSTYIECDVEIERVMPMLDDAWVERIEVYLEENNVKAVVFAEVLT